MNKSFLVMAVLLRGPNFGTGIFEALKPLWPAVTCGPAAIYEALRALKRRKLVIALKRRVHRRGGKQKQFYKLSPAGRRYIKKQRDALAGLLGLVNAPTAISVVYGPRGVGLSTR